MAYFKLLTRLPRRLVHVLRLTARRLSREGKRRVYWWWLFATASDGFAHPQIRVGRYTYGLNIDTVLLPSEWEQVEIGRFCSIAEGVRFIFGEHSLSAVTTYPLRTRLGDGIKNQDAQCKGPIIVGHDVWIGTNAIILSGVTIGNGAVVGAGAVVTKDVPPYAVAAGVPARVIKMRFAPEQIENLQKIAWWNWPEERIRANMDLFYGDVNEFIRTFG